MNKVVIIMTLLLVLVPIFGAEVRSDSLPAFQSESGMTGLQKKIANFNSTETNARYIGASGPVFNAGMGLLFSGLTSALLSYGLFAGGAYMTYYIAVELGLIVTTASSMSFTVSAAQAVAGGYGALFYSALSMIIIGVVCFLYGFIFWVGLGLTIRGIRFGKLDRIQPLKDQVGFAVKL